MPSGGRYEAILCIMYRFSTTTLLFQNTLDNARQKLGPRKTWHIPRTSLVLEIAIGIVGFRAVTAQCPRRSCVRKFFHLYTGAAIAAFYLIYISIVPRVSSEVTV